jgi:uncharacterized protein
VDASINGRTGVAEYSDDVVDGVMGQFSYTAHMVTSFSLSHVDIAALARSEASVSGALSLAGDAVSLGQHFPRLSAESCVPGGLAGVKWSLLAEMRSAADGAEQPWLHLEGIAQLALVCQRCLGPVTVELQADRWFRFVADEETAAAEDDLSEEDVLVLEPRMDAWSLIEDELIMAIPLVPMHEVCPVPVPTSVADDDFVEAQADKPHPFATLHAFKPQKRS